MVFVACSKAKALLPRFSVQEMFHTRMCRQFARKQQCCIGSMGVVMCGSGHCHRPFVPFSCPQRYARVPLTTRQRLYNEALKQLNALLHKQPNSHTYTHTQSDNKDIEERKRKTNVIGNAYQSQTVCCYAVSLRNRI